MKQIILIAFAILGIFCVANFAFADKSPATPANQMQPVPAKDLKLTESQASTLVQAMLIRHNQADAKIQKIDTITLADNKHYYLVYVSLKNNTQTNMFFMVSAQTGHAMPSIMLDRGMPGKFKVFACGPHAGMPSQMMPPMQK